MSDSRFAFLSSLSLSLALVPLSSRPARADASAPLSHPLSGQGLEALGEGQKALGSWQTGVGFWTGNKPLFNTGVYNQVAGTGLDGYGKWVSSTFGRRLMQRRSPTKKLG